MTDGLSQVEREALGKAFEGWNPLTGLPMADVAWLAGRDYGRERERALDKALVALVEWCAGPLGLEGRGAVESNSTGEPINFPLTLGTLRAGMAALGKGRAVLVASSGEPEGQPETEPRSVLRMQAHTTGVCPVCSRSMSERDHRPGEPEGQQAHDGARKRSMSQVIVDAREIERQMAQPDHGPGEPSQATRAVIEAATILRKVAEDRQSLLGIMAESWLAAHLPPAVG